MAETQKIAVLVLGMHRSGTSAFARVINLLGAELPRHLMPAAAGNNEAGFWESQLVAEFDERLLASLGSSWDGFLELAAIPGQRLPAVLAEASALLDAEYGDAGILVLKEPRICRLLPVWKEVLVQKGYDIRCVMPVRNPLEVAGSLEARDGFPRVKGLLLWARYVLDAVRHSVGLMRVPLSFDGLLDDTGKTLQRLRPLLGLSDGARQKSEIASFLSPALRHQRQTWEGFLADGGVPPLVRSLGRLMKAWCDEPGLPIDRAVDALAAEWQSAEIVFGPAVESLTRKLAEQDALIAARDAEIRSQIEMIVKQKQLVEGLTEERSRASGLLTHTIRELRSAEAAIAGYQNSTSWRVTAPLRRASLAVQRARTAVANPAVADDGARSAPVQGKAGGQGERQGETARPAVARQHVECLSEAAVAVAPDLDVAVHAHAFYPELLAEMAGYLANMPVPYTLYVSVTRADHAQLVHDAFSRLEAVRDLVVEVVDNRGRDIAPMLVTFGERLRGHGVVLHVHTKKSPHNVDLRGWRSYLLRALLGSREAIAAVFRRFMADDKLGVLYPAHYFPVQPFVRIGGNQSHMAALLLRAGRPITALLDISTTDFPAGSMFWFRGAAIGRLVDMNLGLGDFEPERGQDDATLAHAIERMFPYLASLQGLTTRAYLPASLYNEGTVGALPLSAASLQGAGTGAEPLRVIFDHDIGGGANRYSQMLIDGYTAQGGRVVRVYRCQRADTWVVQLIASEDGMVHASGDLAELFGALEHVPCAEIIVNSLVGYPDVASVTRRIRDLATTLGAAADYKVHDFFAVCPSQHLLDSRQHYCGVPLDKRACNECLEINPSAVWDGRRPDSIEAWRAPFAELFSVTSAVTVFDPSSVEILRRAFELPDARLRVVPHADDYFQVATPLPVGSELHIGVLGWLTPAKGVHVVNELARHIREQGLAVPITLVGGRTGPLDRHVRVHGPYEVGQLTELVRYYRISVFLMASVVPETFSYSVSEVMKMGLPMVAFDVGAQGRRVAAYDRGRVLPLDSPPAAILEALRAAWSLAAAEAA